MTPEIHLTDIMIRVDSVQDAVGVLTESLNLMPCGSGDDWTMLEDQQSGQRLVLTVRDFGASWALAVSTPNIEKTLTQFAAQGIPVPDKEDLDRHASVTLYQGANDIQILLYKN